MTLHNFQGQHRQSHQNVEYKVIAHRAAFQVKQILL